MIYVYVCSWQCDRRRGTPPGAGLHTKSTNGNRSATMVRTASFQLERKAKSSRARRRSGRRMTRRLFACKERGWKDGRLWWKEQASIASFSSNKLNVAKIRGCRIALADLLTEMPRNSSEEQLALTEPASAQASPEGRAATKYIRSSVFSQTPHDAPSPWGLSLAPRPHRPGRTQAHAGDDPPHHQHKGHATCPSGHGQLPRQHERSKSHT